MNVPIISFIGPVTGVEKQFNTFRLGLKWGKALAPGSVVLLVEKKAERAFGVARVTRVVTGDLWHMCVEHGALNHRELADEDTAGAPERLYGYLQSLFGPHIALPTKKTTVLYLERIR